MDIGSKVYYDKQTGEILFKTAEGSGMNAVETTKEEDCNTFFELKGKDTNNIDFIQLPYGTLSTTFNKYNVKEYKINIVTKKLEYVYHTEEDLKTIQQQNQQVQDLNSRVSDISIYLANSNQDAISDIENSILEIEKNKILEGMM